jgi:hypothetical protein
MGGIVAQAVIDLIGDDIEIMLDRNIHQRLKSGPDP